MSANPSITLLINADNKASQVLQKVQEDVNKAQEEVINSNQKIIESTSKLNVNVMQAAASFASLGAGTTALITSFGDLDKVQLRVASTQKEVTASQAAALQAQLSYQNAVERFGADSIQAEQALLRLQAAQDQLMIAQERARIAQDDLNDTYLNFGANLAPQVISIAFGMQSAFSMLGITSVSQLVPAINSIGTALKSAFITNPIGLTITGVATAVILLTTNAFGLRDAVVAVGDAMFKWMNENLKPVADFLTFLNVNVIQPIVDTLNISLPSASSETISAAEEMNAIFKEQEEIMQANNEAMLAYQSTVNDTSVTFATDMVSSAQIMDSALVGVDATVARNIERFGAMGRTALATAVEVDSSASIMNTSMSNAESAIATSAAGIIKQMNDIAKAITSISGLRFEEQPIARDIPAGSFIETIAREQFTKAKQGEIGSLLATGASLALAAGVSIPTVLGGSFLETSGGFKFNPKLNLGVTSLGTVAYVNNLASKIASGKFFTLTDAMSKGFLSADELAGLKSLGVIPAQHGFEGIVTKPTLFLAGEAGIESVSIKPANNGNTMKLVVQFVAPDGSDIGSETLDLANKEAILRLKAKGVRLF